LRGSAVAFAVKLLAAGSLFAMNVVIARQLGADEAGLFFLAYTIGFIAAAASRLGLDNTHVRSIAAHHFNRLAPGSRGRRNARLGRRALASQRRDAWEQPPVGQNGVLVSRPGPIAILRHVYSPHYPGSAGLS